MAMTKNNPNYGYWTKTESASKPNLNTRVVQAPSQGGGLSYDFMVEFMHDRTPLVEVMNNSPSNPISIKQQAGGNFILSGLPEGIYVLNNVRWTDGDGTQIEVLFENGYNVCQTGTVGVGEEVPNVILNGGLVSVSDNNLAYIDTINPTLNLSFNVFKNDGFAPRVIFTLTKCM